MNLSGKCNVLSLDTNRVLDQLKAYFYEALERASEKLLNIMKKEVLETVWGDGPGKPEWREEASRIISIVNREAASNYVEFGVGIPEGLARETIMKIMVIAEGAGVAVGNGWITAGPPGRIVWDDNLDERKESEAKSEYLLPQGFNQMGNHFVDNAMLLMKKHFKDTLSEAERDQQGAIFYQNVQVKQR